MLHVIHAVAIAALLLLANLQLGGSAGNAIVKADTAVPKPCTRSAVLCREGWHRGVDETVYGAFMSSLQRRFAGTAEAQCGGVCSCSLCCGKTIQLHKHTSSLCT